MLNTKLIPDMRRDVHYVPGNIVVSSSGKIIIMRNDSVWISLYNKDDGTWFFESDYKWYKVIPQKINECYTVGIKVN